MLIYPHLCTKFGEMHGDNREEAQVIKIETGNILA